MACENCNWRGYILSPGREDKCNDCDGLPLIESYKILIEENKNLKTRLGSKMEIKVKKDYIGPDGEPCTLHYLCRKDPEWATNMIEVLKKENENLKQEIKKLKEEK